MKFYLIGLLIGAILVGAVVLGGYMRVDWFARHLIERAHAEESHYNPELTATKGDIDALNKRLDRIEKLLICIGANTGMVCRE